MKGECCRECWSNGAVTDIGCSNPACECHSTHTEIDSLFKEFEEKVCPLIVEDWNNFVIEAGEIGEMDIEEIVSERVKEFFAPKLTTLIPSIEQSVVETIEAKLPQEVPNPDGENEKAAGHNELLFEIRTIIKAFKKE